MTRFLASSRFRLLAIVILGHEVYHMPKERILVKGPLFQWGTISGSLYYSLMHHHLLLLLYPFKQVSFLLEKVVLWSAV